MKDVISILQSRVAKRSNEIRKFSDDTYEGRLSLVDGEYVESPALCNMLAKEQKQDKRILAEIVRLRRQGRKYRHAKALLTSINYFQKMSEKEVLEMENKILAARWGV